MLKRAKKARAGRDPRCDRPDGLSASIVGPITWKGGGPTNPVPNVCTTPLVGGQWKKGKKFKYDLEVVFNKSAPEHSARQPVRSD